MAEYYLGLPGGLTACFKSAHDAKDEAVRLQLGAYVPGLRFLDKKGDIDILFEHKQGEVPGLSERGEHVKLTTLPSEKMPDDVYHLFYGVVRKKLARLGYYCVHAACAGANETGFTLVAGPSGSGKTTVTEFLLRQHKHKLLSGNKTVVRIDEFGQMFAVAGTRTMTALDKGGRRYAYEVNDDTYVQGARRIKNIALVRFGPGSPQAEKLSNLSALHTLYPLFADAVNADVIVNGKDLFDGNPGAGPREQLMRDLKKTIPNQNIVKISGPSSGMARMIARM